MYLRADVADSKITIIVFKIKDYSFYISSLFQWTTSDCWMWRNIQNIINKWKKVIQDVLVVHKKVWFLMNIEQTFSDEALHRSSSQCQGSVFMEFLTNQKTCVSVAAACIWCRQSDRPSLANCDVHIDSYQAGKSTVFWNKHYFTIYLKEDA